MVAQLIMKEIPFILLDDDENTKVAMYVEELGIYTQNYGVIKRVLSWLEFTLNNNRAEETIYHIKNRAEIKRKTESPTLIPVGNGVFNRETGELEPFTPNYVFTTKVNANYVENAQKPLIDGWDIDDWIISIANYDNEIVILLWQVLNDCLNGNYSRLKSIFLVGDGNNGKGTFQDLIKYLVGAENVAYLKIDEFDKQFRTSLLLGKTVCIGDDVPVGVYVDDSSVFKSVVTGDPVLVEFKGKTPFSATFQLTVIQSTNGMPKFKDKTKGNLRRILIVPFKADFNGTIENRKIKTEYIKDKKVLEYVLHKAIKMDFENFITPKASVLMMQSFMQDNDPVYDFKVNKFDKWVNDYTIKYLPQKFVYAVYEKFCDENNYKPLSYRGFNERLSKYLDPHWKEGQDRKLTAEIHRKIIFEIARTENVHFSVVPTKNYRSFLNDSIKIAK
ncbi:nucleoside triphosphatase [Macrococcoides bohemicum]|uniref:DNA primase family protein n=1 Tax=Macrococcoides bohemicum TaxID=1903056 RepID=UPI001C5CC411|nr:DNA primase family protein [Macrococcus bohemicus]QYA45458.1 nucleoside triphosphatase [Macrococcus bohemicus]